MAMRYRQLKKMNTAVGVYRSKIQGRGLFSKSDIETEEMVIEYAGQTIRSRSLVADKRENDYEKRSIGCYFFCTDHKEIIDRDAMMCVKAAAARFINHSCDPGCYVHIVIFAKRKVNRRVRGEELPSNYNFNYEEKKIPCS